MICCAAMKRLFLTCALGLAVGLLAQAADGPKKEEQNTRISDEVAVIRTTEGEMVVEFWPDVAPKTVENFKALAKKFKDSQTKNLDIERLKAAIRAKLKARNAP